MAEHEYTFQQVVDALKKCKQHCPWTKAQTMESYAQEIVSEAHEVADAVAKKDVQNLKEELGDVIWDVLMVAHFAEERGHFSVKDVFQEVIEKMKRRKPFVFQGRSVSMEEAEHHWFAAKARETDEKASNGEK
jgi:NTP pyrophosphatase (non-canonical NTP hydrolase)